MKHCARRWLAVAFLLPAILTSLAADSKDAEDPYQPHTPTLIFYVTGLKDKADTDAIGASVAKLKSAKVVEVNILHNFVRLRFDSHVVSYHQAAQALVEAGATVSKSYDPWLVFNVPDYAKPGNSQKVDAIFAGKRLNSRVHVIALDKTAGRFAVHFLPLKVDEKDPAPQGFNGGHLHHPISDPPPRGLGLPSSYSSSDSPTTAPARG
jgi:hypothetical protein